MASAPIAGGGNEDRIKQHSDSKVYRRETFRGVKNGNTVTATLTTTTTDKDTCLKNGNTITALFSNVEGFNNSSGQAVPHLEALENADLLQQQPLPNAASDDLTRLDGQAAVGQTAEATPELPADNGVIQTGSCVQNQVNCAFKPKQEMQEIRRKFESELEIVRNLVNRIEAIQKQLNI